jgi:glutamate dehydrogenase (NAD(P)+)
VQGFGNVGEASARMFAQAGAKIVAVQDVSGTVYNPAGIDVAALRRFLQETGR